MMTIIVTDFVKISRDLFVFFMLRGSGRVFPRNIVTTPTQLQPQLRLNYSWVSHEKLKGCQASEKGQSF